MKNQLTLFASLFLALTLGTSCNNNTELGTTPPDGRTPLRVTSGIQSRVVNDTWEAGDQIRIYMLKGGELSIPSDLKHSTYTTVAGGKKGEFVPAAADQTIYFPVDGSECDFVAYYYPRLLADAAYQLSIEVTDQSSQNRIDLMAAAKVTGKSKNDAAVAFVFDHKLTKLEILLKADETSITTAELANTVVKITNQAVQGRYNVISGGEVTTLSETPQTVTLLTNGMKAEGIVLPNTDTEGMKLTFTVPALGNQTFEWAVKNAEKSQLFEAGKKYKYTITIAKVGVNVTSSVTDWTAGNGEGEEGEAN